MSLRQEEGAVGERTSGADVVVAGFAALPRPEQEEAYARLSELRLRQLAAEEDETAVLIAALRRVADVTGGRLTPERYAAARDELRRNGVDVPHMAKLVRHFGGWAAAKEALALTEVTPVKKIEARFRARVEGGRPHFSASELEAALRRCADELGRVPLLSEYDAWREKELALMRARGQFPRVPSVSVFRRRFGSWEKTLVGIGFATADVYLRLEPPPERASRLAKVNRYSEETLRDTLMRCVDELGYVPLIAEFNDWRRRELARTRKRKVILPSDSPYRYRYGTWAAALAHFGFDEAAIAGRLAAGRARSDASLAQYQFGRPAA